MPSPDPFSDRSLHPKPWASMVMPIHSCRRTIVKSLDGLHRQQIPWWCEVIFVLDTIKDDTLEIIHNHPFTKKWEIVEISKPGRGLAEGYNIGWKAARSNLVFYMHGDCYPVADDAMLQMHRWLEKENAVAVMPLIDIPQGDWHNMSFWDRVTSSQFRHAKPAHGLSGKFDLIRRDALEKCGGFDEKRFFSAAEDADIVEQLNKVGKVAASDVLCIHAHLHPPESRFISVLRKQAQYGEGGGALIRKNIGSFDFLRRASVIIALNFTKLGLLIGLFIWPLTPYAAILLLLLSAYYGRWAMLSKDWRAPIVPFAVSLMFSINALSMVRGFIQGHQSFHYYKRAK